MKKSENSPTSPAPAAIEKVEFEFETLPFHCVSHEGKPWFVAVHACAALGLSTPAKAIRVLDADEKAEVTICHLSSSGTVQRRRTSIISESGLYVLILRSHGATSPGTKAHRFRKWVTGTVLPSLRETGRYSLHSTSAEQNAAWMVSQIGRIMPLAKLLELLHPLHAYGSLAGNGLPRKGFRRASFVAAPNRLEAAHDFHRRAIILEFLLQQLELPLERGAA